MSTPPLIREYGALRTEELSQRIVLAETEGWKLIHHSAGYEPAGSMARYTQERWSVTVYDPHSNETHGRSFRALSDAQPHFDAAAASAKQNRARYRPDSRKN
jgi:hypothetical protein